jgi:hypothetical protein
MQYLTEDLLTSIKLRAMVPTSQSTFQDADLIQIANEELQLKLVSDIMVTREDFFLTHESKPVLSGVSTYTMPSRAIGNSLKLVWYVDTRGNFRKLIKKDVYEIADYNTSSSGPDGYYIMGDRIVVLPMPLTSGGSIRFEFYARPNQMIPTASCAKIISSSVLAGVITYIVDTDITASQGVGSLVDVVSIVSPFVSWGYQAAVQTISSNSISLLVLAVQDEVGNPLPNIGDYISPTGRANIAQVPQEFHPVLAQMTANRLLLAIGDLNKYNSGMTTLKEDRENALKLIRNRVEESTQVIKNPNGMVQAFTRKF